MKIHVLSDLHLEVAPLEVDDMNADVVVLAGDIDIGAKAILWAKEQFKQPVLFVLGNHEYWHGNAMQETLREMKKEAAGSNVHILDCDSYELEGVRFLGTTLWTDLLKSPFGGVECGVIDRDRQNIQVWEGVSFLDDYAQSLFEKNRGWLKSKLHEPFDGQTVVITHHAPSGDSQHEQYEGNPYASCFITDMENLMGKNVNLWIHGHTHNNFDYNLNGTRVVCNPRGYPSAFGGWENPTFNPRFVVGLDRA